MSKTFNLPWFVEYTEPEERTRDKLIKLAEEANCEAIFADDRTLLIDLDGRDSYNNFWALYDMLIKRVGFLEEPEIYESKSKSGNFHVIIRMREPKPILERVLLQALLSSDLKREIFTYGRVVEGGDDLIVLFKPKGDKEQDYDIPF